MIKEFPTAVFVVRASFEMSRRSSRGCLDVSKVNCYKMADQSLIDTLPKPFPLFSLYYYVSHYVTHQNPESSC
jgi:hypothetical protein